MACFEKHIDLYYSQQFLQIDPRLAYITNEWRFPKVIAKNPDRDIGKNNPPVLLLIAWYNNQFQEMMPLKIYCEKYLNLYDSDENPYIIQKMISPESIKVLLAKINAENVVYVSCIESEDVMPAFSEEIKHCMDEGAIFYPESYVYEKRAVICLLEGNYGIMIPRRFPHPYFEEVKEDVFSIWC